MKLVMCSILQLNSFLQTFVLEVNKFLEEVPLSFRFFIYMVRVAGTKNVYIHS